MVSNQAPSSTRLDPKIRYYIYRNNENTIVPLIPADQLPFRLKDFPPSLDHKQLAEGGWKFLNETSEIPFPLPLLNPYVQHPNTFKPKKASTKVRNATKEVSESDDSMTDGSDEEELSSEMSSMDKNLAAPTQIEDNPRQPKAARIPARSRPTYVRVQSLTDSMAAIYTQDARKFGYNKTMPKRRETVSQEEREYCRRWIKTGECIHTAKGCWYRHEMPSPEKLKEIGIMRIPQWYREKNRIIPEVSLKPSQRPGYISTPDSHIAKAAKGQALGKVNGPRPTGSHGIYTTDAANELMLMDMDDTSSESQRGTIAVPASNSLDNLHGPNVASRVFETHDSITEPLPASAKNMQRSASSSTKDSSEAPPPDSNDPRKDASLASVAKQERSKASSSNTPEASISDETPPLLAVSALEITSKPSDMRSDISHRSSQATTKKTKRTFTLDTILNTPTVLSPNEKNVKATVQHDANLGDPTLRMAEDRAARVARISAKRKVLPRKTCKVQIRQSAPKPRNYISKERGGTDVRSTTVGEARQAVVAL